MRRTEPRTILAVDPSSGSQGSNPAVAYYEDGKLLDVYEIELNGRLPIQKRLTQLAIECAKLPRADVLVIERIRGRMAHEYLKWAVGTIIATASYTTLIEMPIPLWKKTVKNLEGYSKSDVNDAIAIGFAYWELLKEGRIVNGKLLKE